jgi:hypothetical protein
MSSYSRMTKHPLTGKWQMAEWLDDFYGRHRYGVKFTIDHGDGSFTDQVFREEDYNFETKTYEE